MDKKIIIAPVGDNIDALFVGLKEFPTEKVILITPQNKLSKAKQVEKDLRRFKIPTRIVEIKGDNIWEATFETITKIKNDEGDDKRILINVATGDRTTQCATTSAAFVNGLKAFDIDDKGAMLLPVLKFSYYKMLTDKKMNILKLLARDKSCCSSLEELSKRTKMSLPLISYHVHGTPRADGLKVLGLVDTYTEKGRVSVNLSPLGRMLIKGYVS